MAFQLLTLSAAAYGERYDECISFSFPRQQQRYVHSVAKAQCDQIDSICEAFIVVSNVTKEAIVVFRGTKTTGQLILEGWESYGKGTQFFDMGTVNRYFRKAHTHMWQPVADFLALPEFSSFSLIFTGHSLGGALASLGAARTVVEGHRPASSIRMYSFGQPRTGSFDYATAYDALRIESYRVVFRADIVPHQPSCQKDESIAATADGSMACWAGTSNMAYHHGIEIWYPEEMIPGAYRECTGTPKNEDMNCSDVLIFKAENMDVYIWDHRHYFGTFVTGFGKSGCTNMTKSDPPKQSGLAKLLGKVSDFFEEATRD